MAANRTGECEAVELRLPTALATDPAQGEINGKQSLIVLTVAAEAIIIPVENGFETAYAERTGARQAVQRLEQPTRMEVCNGTLCIGGINGRILCLGLPGGEIVCELKDGLLGRVLHTVSSLGKQTRAQEVSCLASLRRMHGDRHLLAAGHIDGGIRLWDLTNPHKPSRAYTGSVPGASSDGTAFPELLRAGSELTDGDGRELFVSLSRQSAAMEDDGEVSTSFEVHSIAVETGGGAGGGWAFLRHIAPIATLDAVRDVARIDSDNLAVCTDERIVVVGSLRAATLVDEADDVGAWMQKSEELQFAPLGRFEARSAQSLPQGSPSEVAALSEIAERGLVSHCVLAATAKDVLEAIEREGGISEREKASLGEQIEKATSLSQAKSLVERILAIARENSPAERQVHSFFRLYAWHYRRLHSPLAFFTPSGEVASHSVPAPSFRLGIVAESSSMSLLTVAKRHPGDDEGCGDEAERAAHSIVNEALNEFGSHGAFFAGLRLWEGEPSSEVVASAANCLKGLNKRSIDRERARDDAAVKMLREGNQTTRQLQARLAADLQRLHERPQALVDVIRVRTKSVAEESVQHSGASSAGDGDSMDVDETPISPGGPLEFAIASFDAAREAKSRMKEAFAAAIASFVAWENRIYSSERSLEDSLDRMERMVVAKGLVGSDHPSPVDASKKRRKCGGFAPDIHDLRISKHQYDEPWDDGAGDHRVHLESCVLFLSGCAMEKPQEALEWDISKACQEAYKQDLRQSCHRAVEALRGRAARNVEGGGGWAEESLLRGIVAMESGKEAQADVSGGVRSLVRSVSSAEYLAQWMSILGGKPEGHLSKGRLAELLSAHAEERRRPDWAKELAKAALRWQAKEAEARLRWRLFRCCLMQGDEQGATTHLAALEGREAKEGVGRLVSATMDAGKLREVAQMQVPGRSAALASTVGARAVRGRQEAKAAHAVLTARGQHKHAAEAMLTWWARAEYEEAAEALLLVSASLRLVPKPSRWLPLQGNSWADSITPSEADIWAVKSLAQAILKAEGVSVSAEEHGAFLAERLASVQHFGPARVVALRAESGPNRERALRAIARDLAAVGCAFLVASALGRCDDAEALARPRKGVVGPLGKFPLGDPEAPRSAEEAFASLKSLIDRSGESSANVAAAAAQAVLSNGGGRVGVPEWLAERSREAGATLPRALLEQGLVRRAGHELLEWLDRRREVLASPPHHGATWFPYHLATACIASLPEGDPLSDKLAEGVRFAVRCSQQACGSVSSSRIGSKL